MIRFEVRGHPITQGSMRAFVNRYTGRAAVTSSNQSKMQLWRHAVSDEARKARETANVEMFAGPVAVSVEFRLARPASAPKRRITWPIGARSGDVDKLARAVLDALTGVLFVDDSQVTRLQVSKLWGEPGATVLVGSHERIPYMF